MDNHFLTEIEIEKFKCFSNFKAEGFKRVNLIGGKNNVGKTAFMEACYVNVSGDTAAYLISALGNTKFKRERINVLKNISLENLLDSIEFYSTKSNIIKKSFSIKEENVTKKFCLKVDDREDTVDTKSLSTNIIYKDNIHFIDNFGWANSDLMRAFQIIQKLDKETELNCFISEFDDSIEIFKVIGDKPQCKVNGEYRDITEFGDGLKHYISIICALYACENGYLFIDEIDNGIHYTQHDRLWELIFELSEKTNCQVFAITHSKEMLESFARVAKDLEDKDISYTILVKNKQQEIKTISLDYEAIIDSILEQGHEVR